MNFVGLIITLPMAVALTVIGLYMVKMSSVNSDFDEFIDDPQSRNLIEKFFFWWTIESQRDLIQSLISAFGDNIVTWFFRIAGGFFLFVGVIGLYLSVRLLFV